MEFHQQFTNIDWMVVAGYLLLTTWVGHLLKGSQSTIKDFFLGGRSLPWQAVSGSIIATEISGVTFIGVPGMIYAQVVTSPTCNGAMVQLLHELLWEFILFGSLPKRNL